MQGGRNEQHEYPEICFRVLKVAASWPGSLRWKPGVSAAQARRQEMAEEAAYEAKRVEAERKRTTAHVAGMQNRQLRDMLAWHRLLARNPMDPIIKCACHPQHTHTHTQ